MTEIHNAISAFENALKLVFDLIAAENALSKKVNLVQNSEPTVQSVEAEKMAEKMATDELCLDAEEEMMETTATEAAHCEAARPIKGAMRVGLLSKGLLLRGDLLAEHFVVICSERPTRSLIQKIFDHLPAQLEIVSPSKKFNVETRFEEAGLFVTIEEPAVSFAVTLTSMLIVEDQEQVDPHPSAPSDQLSPGHCLSALALMRRTKWFQMRPWEMKSGTVVAHVLRDFCRRNGIWRPLSEWALVLLVKMGIFAAGIDIGPGEALRSFFECISSGILLPGGYGLMDPCEMVPTDVTAYLTEQQCEEITASAQQCLRPLVYRQLYKILDIAQFSGSGFKRLRDPEDEPEREDDKKLKQEDPEDEPEREDDRKQEDPEDKPEREDDKKQEDPEDEPEREDDREQEDPEDEPEREDDRKQEDPEDEPERGDDRKQEDPEDEPEREDDRKQEDPEDKPEREDDKKQEDPEDEPEREDDREQEDPEDEPEREDDRKQEDPEDEPEREDDRKQEDPEDEPEREDDRKLKQEDNAVEGNGAANEEDLQALAID